MLRQTMSYCAAGVQPSPLQRARAAWWKRRHWAHPSGQREVELKLECEVLVHPSLYDALSKRDFAVDRPEPPPLDSLVHLLPRRAAAASLNKAGDLRRGWLEWRHALIIAEQVRAICHRSFSMRGAERRLLPPRRTNGDGLTVDALLEFQLPTPNTGPRHYLNLAFYFRSDDGELVDGRYPARKAALNVHIRPSTKPTAARDAAELVDGVADCLALFNDGFFSRHHRAIHELDEFPRVAPRPNEKVRYGELVYRHSASERRASR